MYNPLISIALATFNGDKYLRQQLDSIYTQTYKNIEIIACDDCSKDSTLEILKEYNQKFGLVYYVNEENIGFVKTFEKAISFCKGDFIALSDQDDIWIENKLEILLNEIGENLIIHSDSYIIDDQNNVLSNSYANYANKLIKMATPIEFFFHNSITGCTLLFKKQLLDYALPFPIYSISHDWWLALVAVKLNAIKYINIPLQKYRQHTSNTTGAKASVIDDIKNIFKNGIFAESRIKSNYYFYNWYTEIYNYQRLNFNNQEKSVLLDLISYYKSFFDEYLRIKSFIIHLKYFKYFYPHNNIFVRIMRLFLSIIGRGVEK